MRTKAAAKAAFYLKQKEAAVRQALVFMQEDLVGLTRAQVGIAHVVGIFNPTWFVGEHLAKSRDALETSVAHLQNAINWVEFYLEGKDKDDSTN